MPGGRKAADGNWTEAWWGQALHDSWLVIKLAPIQQNHLSFQNILLVINIFVVKKYIYQNEGYFI